MDSASSSPGVAVSSSETRRQLSLRHRLFIRLPGSKVCRITHLNCRVVTPVALLAHLGFQPEFYNVYVLNWIEGLADDKQQPRLALHDFVDLSSFVPPEEGSLGLLVEPVALTESEMRAILADRES